MRLPSQSSCSRHLRALQTQVGARSQLQRPCRLRCHCRRREIRGGLAEIFRLELSQVQERAQFCGRRLQDTRGRQVLTGRQLSSSAAEAPPVRSSFSLSVCVLPSLTAAPRYAFVSAKWSAGKVAFSLGPFPASSCSPAAGTRSC